MIRVCLGFTFAHKLQPEKLNSQKISYKQCLIMLVMTSNKPHETLGWEFTYKLSDEIDCNTDIGDRQNIEFLTGSRKKQKTITRFKIKVYKKDKSDAEQHANQIALRLTWLLVATSGTYSTYSLFSGREMVASGMCTIIKNLTIAYQKRNNAILNMDNGAFQEIFARGTDLADKVQFIAKARQAAKTGDSESVIKYLILAYKEQPPASLKKFTSLRNAISHNDEALRQHTISGLENGFGQSYFKLTASDQFDFEDAQNLRRLATESDNFLNDVYANLRNELISRSTSEGSVTS